MIGQILGERYLIEQLIGMGATARVYSGFDTRLQRTVAIKVLMEDVPETVRERFESESQNVARLNHPGIMAVHDVGKENDTNYLVIEYIEGRPLTDYIPASPEITAELGAQICLALDYAHRMGIIHRDIKPANIYVCPGNSIKLMDFGMAIPVEGRKRITALGSVIGTPAYLSPEQAQGQPLTPLTDLYSLGAVLYEMATGLLPFDADDIPAILFQHVHKPPVPPSEFVPDIPRWLEYVILKALEKNPRKRFQSGAEMAEALMGNVSDSELRAMRLKTPDPLEEMRVELEEEAAALGYPVPQEPFALPAGLLANATRQIIQRVRGGHTSEQSEDTPLEVVNTYQQLSNLYFVTGKHERLAYTAMRCVNMVESYQPSSAQVKAYATASVVTRMMHLPQPSRAYARQACEIGKQVPDPAIMAHALLRAGAFRNELPEWQELADVLLQLGEGGNGQEPDMQLRYEADVFLGLVHYLLGDFIKAEWLMAEVHDVDREMNSPDRQVWRLCGQIFALLRLGRTDDAATLLAPLHKLRDEKLGRIAKISYHAARAQLFLQQSIYDAALAEADIAARYIVEVMVGTLSTIEVFYSIGEVYVGVWEQTGDVHAPVARNARQWCTTMFNYAVLHTFAQPRTWLIQGRIHWIMGHHDRARKAWNKALDSAKLLAMPYEEGRAYYEIGRHITVGDPRRESMLTNACEVFGKLNAVYDLRLTQDALSEG